MKTDHENSVDDVLKKPGAEPARLSLFRAAVLYVRTPRATLCPRHRLASIHRRPEHRCGGGVRCTLSPALHPQTISPWKPRGAVRCMAAFFLPSARRRGGGGAAGFGKRRRTAACSSRFCCAPMAWSPGNWAGCRCSRVSRCAAGWAYWACPEPHLKWAERPALSTSRRRDPDRTCATDLNRAAALRQSRRHSLRESAAAGRWQGRLCGHRASD